MMSLLKKDIVELHVLSWSSLILIFKKASLIFKERNSFHLPMSPIKHVDGERNEKQSAISFLKPVQSKMRNSFVGYKNLSSIDIFVYLSTVNTSWA